MDPVKAVQILRKQRCKQEGKEGQLVSVTKAFDVTEDAGDLVVVDTDGYLTAIFDRGSYLPHPRIVQVFGLKVVWPKFGVGENFGLVPMPSLKAGQAKFKEVEEYIRSALIRLKGRVVPISFSADPPEILLPDPDAEPEVGSPAAVLQLVTDQEDGIPPLLRQPGATLLRQPGASPAPESPEGQ